MRWACSQALIGNNGETMEVCAERIRKCYQTYQSMPIYYYHPFTIKNSLLLRFFHLSPPSSCHQAYIWWRQAMSCACLFGVWWVLSILESEYRLIMPHGVGDGHSICIYLFLFIPVPSSRQVGGRVGQQVLGM